MKISVVLATTAATVVLAKQYDQQSKDQFNLLHMLGGTGPFVQHPGYGIPTDVPDSCQIDQLFLFMRHGERFPTTGTGKGFKEVIAKLQANANGSSITGPLSFLNDYQYFVPNENYYELESYSGDYAGLGSAFQLGSKLRDRYENLFDNEQVLPVFTSGQERVVQTAKSFAQGFFNSNYSTLASIQVIPEKETQGANSLTVTDACVNFNSSFNDDLLSQWSRQYMEVEAARLNNLSSPFLNITSDDIFTLLGYCGFELNVAGSSKMCEALSQESFVYFGYDKDLSTYYEQGPGYSQLAVPLGGVYANATATLLKQGPEEVGSLFFSFSHDNDLLRYVTALGLLDNGSELPTDRIDFFRSFKSSDIIPMSGRLITERLSCFNSTKNDTEIYVRTMLNDAVVPLADCQSGPGFSCPLEDYLEYVDDRISSTNATYVEACGVNSTYPQFLSFYWDWEVTFENN